MGEEGRGYGRWELGRWWGIKLDGLMSDMKNGWGWFNGRWELGRRWGIKLDGLMSDM